MVINITIIIPLTNCMKIHSNPVKLEGSSDSIFSSEGRIVMVKHVILWQLKDDVENKEEIKKEAKKSLEALKGVVPGLLEITVNIDCLESSNADVMLDSTLESEEALKGYAVHPAHVEVATTKVAPFMKTRVCMDYEI